MRIRKILPIIRQAGSLIQQNHGESLTGHGYTMWNLDDLTYEHIEIENRYGHFTITIDNGVLVTDITDMPKKVKLRVNCKESLAAEVKTVVSKIRESYEITEITYVRLSGDTDCKKMDSSEIGFDVSDLSNIDYQNELLKTNIEDSEYKVDESTLKTIFELNKRLNGLLVKDNNSSRNIKWIPKKFEFSNVFSYGENNVIDFSKLNGTIGLFGPNRVGKSSVLEALSFCIFDKTSKTSKAGNLMNVNSMNMYTKFTFQINEIDYEIERTGTRDKKGSVSVKVSFSKTVNGEKISLNGEMREKTNDIIRNYLGNHDDFLLTILSIQGPKAKNISDMGQSERKELLCKFVGIDIFEKLHELATNESKETATKLKIFKRDEFEQKKADLTSELEIREAKESELKTSIKKIEDEISKLNDEKIELTKKLIPLDNIPKDINKFTQLKSEIESKITSAKSKENIIAESLSKLNVEIENIKNQLSGLNENEISEKYKKHLETEKLLNLTNNKISQMKTTVTVKLEKLENLKKHEYDPNCKYCVNNIFVKDAKNVELSIENDKNEFRKLTDERTSLEKSIRDTISVVDEMERIKSLHKDEMSLIVKKSNFERELSSLNIQKLENELFKTDSIIEQYNKCKESIYKNSQIEYEIASVQVKLNSKNYEMSPVKRELLENTSRLGSIKDQLVEIQNKIETASKLEEENLAYEIYLKMVASKDGIPYKLLSKILPTLQREVNGILSQICEFSIKLEAEGSNVNIYIVEEDRQWLIEMTSGMEKFITSLAMRVALIGVSNIPRSNFICLDEGFGTLSPEYISTMPVLFSFLKTQFEFVIVISHLEQMRDFVDTIVEIKKTENYSSINHV